MRAFKLLICLTTLAVLAGCSSRDERKLDTYEPWGSNFTKALSQEYRSFAIEKSTGTLGWLDADDSYFDKKGRHTIQGKILEPERLEDWDIDGAQMAELQQARAHLMIAYAKHSRALAPQSSAAAQAAFDCWVEEAEDGDEQSVQACKGAFMRAMADIDSILGRRPEPAPEPQIVEVAPKVEPVPVQPVKVRPQPGLVETPEYIIYFAFDSSRIDQEGLAQLGEMLNDVQIADVVNIRLVGHTDTMGAPQYNVDLSKRRANAVKSVLVNNGVDNGKINVKGMGESQLALQTGDEVAERLNRRVEIFIINPEPAQ